MEARWNDLVGCSLDFLDYSLDSDSHIDRGVAEARSLVVGGDHTRAEGVASIGPGHTEKGAG